MDTYSRFQVFTRNFGLQIKDSPPLLITNDPAEALRICQSAMRREEGSLASTTIRDVITGKEYGGVEVFQFANEFSIRFVG
jgi:hypothetical protein